MAEEYRSKYLALEREFNYLKHTHEYDLEKVQQDLVNKQEQLTERIQFHEAEAQAKLDQAMAEKDEQIGNLIDDNRNLINRLK